MLKNGPSNEEKKEFLAREEVRTMEKDIAKLQELKSKAERERIASLKTDENQKVSQGAIMASPAPQPQLREEKIPLGKTGSFEKILIRGVVIFFLFLLGSFFYWFFWVK